MTTTPESWEQQLRGAAHTNPESLRNRLYAESWSDGTGRRAVDLDRAADIAHAEVERLTAERAALWHLLRKQTREVRLWRRRANTTLTEAVEQTARDMQRAGQLRRERDEARTEVEQLLEAKREAVREARRVISQYLVTAEQWRYDRVMWAFSIMLGEIPDDSLEPRSPADAEARTALSEPAADTTPQPVTAEEIPAMQHYVHPENEDYCQHDEIEHQCVPCNWQTTTPERRERYLVDLLRRVHTHAREESIPAEEIDEIEAVLARVTTEES